MKLLHVKRFLIKKSPNFFKIEPIAFTVAKNIVLKFENDNGCTIRDIQFWICSICALNISLPSPTIIFKFRNLEENN